MVITFIFGVEWHIYICCCYGSLPFKHSTNKTLIKKSLDHISSAFLAQRAWSHSLKSSIKYQFIQIMFIVSIISWDSNNRMNWKFRATKLCFSAYNCVAGVFCLLITYCSPQLSSQSSLVVVSVEMCSPCVLFPYERNQNGVSTTQTNCVHFDIFYLSIGDSLLISRLYNRISIVNCIYPL